MPPPIPKPVERLILLKLHEILEKIDPEKALEHDRDAQAAELGTPADIARLFESIDLDPVTDVRMPKPYLVKPAA